MVANFGIIRDTRIVDLLVRFRSRNSLTAPPTKGELLNHRTSLRNVLRQQHGRVLSPLVICCKFDHNAHASATFLLHKGHWR